MIMMTNKSQYMDFHEFKNRIIIEGDLILKTQLHVGSGELILFGADNPVIEIKYADRNRTLPYIPGSSIKGLLRAYIEKLAKLSSERVCMPPNVCEENNFCIVCGIFGGKNLAAHMRISDAILDGSHAEKMTKPGILINRITGTVQSGQLYQIETIAPGTKFKLRIIIDNIYKDEKRFKLIIQALNALRNGILQIGGKRSIGLGHVFFENINITEYTPKSVLGEEEPKKYSFEELTKEVSIK